jgi:outer membrane protein assembly factor BamA
MGGSSRMRGFYDGRFNDRNMITFQAELRQNIWRRIGATVWGGAGNVFESFDTFRWNQTLPNYGIGLRWEFKKRVNIRIDYGFGRKDNFGRMIHSFMFQINEAF